MTQRQMELLFAAHALLSFPEIDSHAERFNRARVAQSLMGQVGELEITEQAKVAPAPSGVGANAYDAWDDNCS